LARTIFVLLLCWPVSARCEQIVRVPLPEAPGDRRYEYPRKVLELALSKVHKDYRVEDATVRMNQDRQVAELIAGRFIDVAQLPFSAEREAVLLPIRIPLHKGLIGWRIGLIRKGDQARFSKIKTADDLKAVRIGQGSEWPDVRILRSNGMNVVTGVTYDGLFGMLQAGRFDYFMRDVIEIWDELRDHADTMEIEQSFVVHYYYDAYFFVNKGNTKLAEDVRQGLEQAIADGSFEKLFQQYWSDCLRKARLNERTVIELPSPDVNSETPIWRHELWYSLERSQ